MANLDSPKMAIVNSPKELARKLITTKPEDYVVGNAAKAGLKKFASKHPVLKMDIEDKAEDEDVTFSGSKQSKEKTTRRADYTIDQSQAAYESVDLEPDSNAQKEDAVKSGSKKNNLINLIKDIKSKKHTKKETEGTDTTEPRGKIKTALPKNVTESTGDMSDAAHELALHAGNDHHLYRNSYVPVAKNLEKKFKKGTYNHDLAKKLWSYHADRAAQSYAKQHGDVKTPWHKMFTTADRKQAAAHMADNHKAEMEAGNFHEGVEWDNIPPLTEAMIMELGEPMTQAPATSDNPGGADTAPVSGEEGKESSDDSDDSSENSQAKDDLEHIALVAAETYELLSAEDKEMPSWILEKLTLAKDFVTSVQEYIEENSEDEDEGEDEPEGNQAGVPGKPGSDETNTPKPSAYKEEVELDETKLGDVLGSEEGVRKISPRKDEYGNELSGKGETAAKRLARKSMKKFINKKEV